MWKNIFKVLDKKNFVSDDDIKKIPSFIFVRWLANNPNTVLISNQINQYSKIPIVNQYKMIHDMVGGKRIFIQYPKNLKNDESLNSAFMWWYTIGVNQVQYYKEFTSDEDTNKIINLYNEYTSKKEDNE